MAEWRNWSRELTAAPAHLARPSSTEGVVAAVERAGADGLRVRPVGAGHSFTPLAVGGDVMLDVRACDRLLDVDLTAGRIRVGAGVHLADLAEILDRHRLAMVNLGDIDRQTLAGATATATHGTGAAFGNLATQIRSLRLVDGRGQVHDIAFDDDRLDGVRVNLGALGVVTEIELEVMAAFTLHGHDRTEPLADVMAEFDSRVAAHRHFELYAFPYAGTALTRTNDAVDGPPRPPGAIASWINDRLLTTHALAAISRLGRRAPAVIPRLNRVVAAAAGEHVRIDASHRVFASARDVRFTEMELCVPREAAMELLGEILDLIEAERLPVNFPIEVRTAAADTLWLSPAHQRDAAYLAVHNFVGLPYDGYFAGVWELARRHHARPHWGKRHPATAAELAGLYPRWDDFARLRAQLDPDGRFANDHLDRVLGPVTAP